ncbi:DegT/DnrJ/EryC1/StrS family aminotransferase [bacterium]|nr:DegT/DnrJ/EryC1/StrS family aminotransferase [bacterium]
MRDELLKLHVADMGEEEVAALREALAGGWLTRGPRTTRFEQELGRYVGAEQMLGTNSCTAALHLGLSVAGIGPGDEVIVPAQTFAASANVVVHCGARPVLADVRPDTHTIDPGHVAELITERTRAIIPVHFAGTPADLDELAELADKHGLFLMEDCAHAIEAQYRGRPVGVGGCPATRFAAYSFYTTKNLITGEGGMLACRTPEDRQRAQVLGLHGMSADAWQRYSSAGGGGFRLYDIIAAGYKYNMFDLQAALGLAQLAKLDANWERRRERVAQYNELIAGVEGVTPLAYPAYVKPAYHIYLVRLDPALLKAAPVATDGAPHASPVRDGVINALRRRQVEAYVHYICLSETEFYRRLLGTDDKTTPVAADLARRSITLPLFPTMAPADVEYVVAMLKEALSEICG